MILVSRPVRQALAFDALHRARRPFSIDNAEARAVVVPERKLIQVALNVLLAAVNVGATHPALELQEKVFDVVGRIAALVHVFAAGVNEGFVRGEFLADAREAGLSVDQTTSAREFQTGRPIPGFLRDLENLVYYRLSKPPSETIRRQPDAP